MARVVELNSYPVKGGAPVALADTMIGPAGLPDDRNFLVISSDGVFRSQRRDPRLALIQPLVSADHARLSLRAPDIEPLTIDVDIEAPRRQVLMFNKPYQAIDQGEQAAEWLSTVLRAPSRLTRVPPEHARVTDGLIPGTSAFPDSCAVHLTSQTALRTLNGRIAERGAPELPMNRFRANIVVDGWPEPNQEDEIRQVTVGSAELGYAKLAIRCAVTLVDQHAGRRTGPEPLRTLAGYRRAREGGVSFGIKLAVLRPGKCSVGDELQVTTWGPTEF
ncbi:MAG TPA: MOSC N-terminal beta barrel domain-containing protein [Pseudonocardiaceae bacterium]|nr:MOSC N-terminal beta barrel domain-containing protein [Pseudonocardiaceae bacterium]